jgi:hypothetical protein
LASCFGGDGGGGGGGALVRLRSDGGGVLSGLAAGLRSGLATVVVVPCGVPLLSCSCSAGVVVVACVPAGFPEVVEVAFSSLRLVVFPVSAGVVVSLALGVVPVPAGPDGEVVDGDVVSLVFGVTPPGPVVPGAAPLLASLPLPVWVGSVVPVALPGRALPGFRFPVPCAGVPVPC